MPNSNTIIWWQYILTWQNGRELATSKKNGITTTYKYGADGLRISKSGYEFFYSDGRLVRQIWADGEVLDFLYDESGTPYAMQYYSTMYYYVKNLQGDIIAIADANGNIVVNYVYDAWGNILSITDGSGNDISNNIWHIGNLNPIRYRSYYYDTETNFYYLQTRYYDPAIRRFINADGYVNANGDILGFNMYAYCGNNPVMNVDYTGEVISTTIIVGGIIVSAVAGLANGITSSLTGGSFWRGFASGAIAGAVGYAIGMINPGSAMLQLGARAASSLAGNISAEIIDFAIDGEPITEDDCIMFGLDVIFDVTYSCVGYYYNPILPGKSDLLDVLGTTLNTFGDAIVDFFETVFFWQGVE